MFTVNFDPILFSVGSLPVYWYGFLYFVSFALAAWYTFRKIAHDEDTTLRNDEIWDLLFWVFLGIIVGGRLGFVFFYDPDYYVAFPLEIFQLYKGGMSFHGGLLGAAIAGWLFCKSKKISFLSLADKLIIMAPVGIMLGRIGNFINGELFGKPADFFFSMKFPRLGGDVQRHPSQLYEAFFEGLVLFFILLFFQKRSHKHSQKPGTLFWIFVFCYGSFRFFLEFFREPDKYWDNAYLFSMTAGQWLSIPMIGLAAVFLLKGKSAPIVDVAKK
ncbi:MAG: prolipoprotein diacylglyceryl transferase [Parcubacteria group bacterium]|nr:prolipoprotein diacylglyceryl transferase [Parcubacteria group bacterium]